MEPENDWRSLYLTKFLLFGSKHLSGYMPVLFPRQKTQAKTKAVPLVALSSLGSVLLRHYLTNLTIRRL